MIRYLTLPEVIELHRRIIARSGGAADLRSLEALEAALGQPKQTFGGEDLYPSLPAKASALGFSLIANHPFVDGNKRVGHASIEAMLMLNGYQLEAPVDEAEDLILAVAAGDRSREDLQSWIERHLRPFQR